jgi:hypothetical protein
MKNEEIIPLGEQKQIFYNMAVPGTLFLITAVILLWILKVVNGHLPTEISLPGLFLVVFASFRMIRGATYDKLLRFVREKFKYDVEVVEQNGQKMAIRRLVKPGFRRAINETLECPWCTGFWTTLIALFVYFISPVTWIVLAILAFSAGATFLQIFTNLVATKYEELDRKNDEASK